MQEQAEQLPRLHVMDCPQVEAVSAAHVLLVQLGAVNPLRDELMVGMHILRRTVRITIGVDRRDEGGSGCCDRGRAYCCQRCARPDVPQTWSGKVQRAFKDLQH